MNLLRQLQDQYGVSYLLIAHNLATVRYMSHQVGVMYLGRMVEQAPVRRVVRQPQPSLTPRRLIAASLPSHPDIEREEMVISGEVPSPLNPPSGCHFHPRCPVVMERCSVDDPEIRQLSPVHQVACHLF